ncbi:hypothetical protein [Acidiluteibacter ferrifornacis]|uniref:Outer membrane protein beta-barrel domain-containing protein n=1 Tax=Acidiluteibacter ferrifornacis TaxID=2692424 RepID=A0A6N9NJZ5_9FLAO|nr:hypothetical protein [Acidiluteibacter ferrifornacis]NBG66192.1 hypothetical protein [Acidiluteibacter ferrifornacis]
MKKKMIFAVAAVLISGVTMGQELLTSKKGVPILPEAGDYAIGVDATPFLDYAGNLFNGNLGNTSPGFSYSPDRPFSIYGKRFIDANSAYRATFRLGVGNNSISNNVADVTDTTGEKFVEDKTTNSGFNVTLGLGKEWRRGKGRLQGVYGGEALVNLNSSKFKNEYGNSLQDIDDSTLTRTLEVKNGFGFGITVRAFVGVEYFIAPKMSIGAEYGYALGFNTRGYGETTTEALEPTGTTSTTVDTGTKATGFGLDTDASGFNIKFNFHF